MGFEITQRHCHLPPPASDPPGSSCSACRQPQPHTVQTSCPATALGPLTAHKPFLAHRALKHLKKLVPHILKWEEFTLKVDFWLLWKRKTKTKTKWKKKHKKCPTWWPHWTCISRVETWACPLDGMKPLPVGPWTPSLSHFFVIASESLGTFELAAPAQTFPGLKTSFFCIPLPQALFGDWLIPSFQLGCTSESPGAQGKTSQARLHPWPVKVKSESLRVRPRPRIKKTKSQLLGGSSVYVWDPYKRFSIQEWFTGLFVFPILPEGVND